MWRDRFTLKPWTYVQLSSVMGIFMIRSSSSFFGGIFLLGFFGAANPLQKVQFALAVLFGVSETWTCDPKINSTTSFFCRFSFLPGRNSMKKSLAPSPPPTTKTHLPNQQIPWAKKFPLRKPSNVWLLRAEILGLVTWKALPLRILEGLQGLAFGVVSSITGTSALEAVGELRFKVVCETFQKKPSKKAIIWNELIMAATINFFYTKDGYYDLSKNTRIEVHDWNIEISNGQYVSVCTNNFY